MLATTAYAHDLAESLYEPLPEGLFGYKFDFDPTLIFFLVLFYLYFKGLRSFKGRKPIKNWQRNLFCLGMGINVIALSPPIDPLSDRLFFMHMIQHMLLVDLGIPLMLFGAPFFVISRGLGKEFRKSIFLPVITNPITRFLHRLISNPIIALALFNINYWFWHYPRFYNWALLNDWIHLLEHAMMAWTAIYLWRQIIDPYPLKSNLHMGFRLLFLGAIMALNTVLSAALTFADEIWYAYEGIPMPAWWAKNWNHLDDQRLGGLIMWVPGGSILFLSMTICFFVWVQREQSQEATVLPEHGEEHFA